MLSLPNFLQKNPRILLLIVGLILVGGCVSLVFSPRMEDPRLTPRVARLITILPGADSERVESLVTEKIERAIREVEEVKEVSSFSSSNVSFVVMELHDAVDEAGVQNAWSRVRDKAKDALREMPPETQAPEFTEYDIMASAAILALRWDLDSKPNYAVLTRLIKELRDEIDLIAGTEKTELYGDPQEEILVSLDPYSMTAMNLRAMDVSRSIAASDSKGSAGLLRSKSNNIPLEIAGELDTLTRIGQIPVQLGAGASQRGSNFVELADVAQIEKTIKLPLETKMLLNQKPAIGVAAQIEPEKRIDVWAGDLDKILAKYEARLPAGITLQRVFEQHHYVTARTTNLFNNLVCGAVVIFCVVLIMMGWRSAWIVGIALPLVSMSILAAMYWMEIPIHQMSITGLIISLGLMIDNAIVVVDEISQRLKEGMSRQEAVSHSTNFLLMPLIGSTLTTALSFSPIILMEGGAGEFVGSIAAVAVVAIASSFALAMTVIASVAGMCLSDSKNPSWINHGISSRWLTSIYGWVIEKFLRVPVAGVLFGITLPICGFIVATDLHEEFFPPAGRNQFRVDLELPATASLDETERYACSVGDLLRADDQVEDVKWFLGKSALMFYYSVLPMRQNAPQFGQAIVECKEGTNTQALIRKLQAKVDPQFPKATVLLRQLEQGPGFVAPIEVRLAGPDDDTLHQVGDELRLLLSETQHVIHTRCTFTESSPKVTFKVDEQQARLAGLDHASIANELNMTLEGVTGGSIVEATEELPVRVRVSGEERADLSSVASLDVLSHRLPRLGDANDNTYRGVPISAISKLQLKADTVSIFRRDSRRMNEIQAYLDAGILPATVLADFRQRLAASDIEIPAGYELTYGGAEEQRDDAVGSLIGNMFMVIALMITALVVSLGSFRLAALLFCIAGLSIGLGLGSLWLAGYPWGFMSMVGMMGMIGVAVNDSIVVLAAIQSLPPEQSHSIDAIRERVVACTRHILSTTLTTIIGFTPLFLFGGAFWAPVAIAISGGVGGATLIALVMVPCAYLLIGKRVATSPKDDPPSEEEPQSKPDAKISTKSTFGFHPAPIRMVRPR